MTGGGRWVPGMTFAATDPDRLLPGEDPHSPQLEDASHWIRVYSELCTAKAAMIENLVRLLESRSPETREELEQVDLYMLQEQMRRFQRRLTFWNQRQLELLG